MRVWKATELDNVAQFYGEPHVLMSLKGNQLWIVLDKDVLSEAQERALRRMGFEDMPGFDNLFYYTNSLSQALSVVKKIEKMGVEDVVCTGMSEALYVKIREFLGGGGS